MPDLDLSEKAYRRLQEYATVSGKTLNEAAAHVVNVWMDSTGDDLIWMLEKKRKAEIIQQYATQSANLPAPTTCETVDRTPPTEVKSTKQPAPKPSQQEISQAFEEWLGDGDAIHAGGMGIRLG